MKERLGLTEIRKQANRMSFGEVSAAPRLVRGCRWLIRELIN